MFDGFINNDSDGFVVLNEKLNLLGLNTENAITIEKLFIRQISNLLDQVIIQDKKKLMIYLDEEDELLPHAMISYIGTD